MGCFPIAKCSLTEIMESLAGPAASTQADPAESAFHRKLVVNVRLPTGRIACISLSKSGSIKFCSLFHGQEGCELNLPQL